MTKLYWAPHTCAIGIHVLLEEIGSPYETEKLSTDHLTEPAFQAINPKGKLPTLRRDDGSVLTEYGVIAYWLGQTRPEAKLIPADKELETRGAEMMDYAIGTLHSQGFARMFKPARFEPQDIVHQAGLGAARVRQQGREMVEKGFAILDHALGTRAYAGGDTLSIFDTALFYVERWASEVEIALPAALAAHLKRMNVRLAVQRVLQIWGEPS